MKSTDSQDRPQAIGFAGLTSLISDDKIEQSPPSGAQTSKKYGERTHYGSFSDATEGYKASTPDWLRSLNHVIVNLNKKLGTPKAQTYGIYLLTMVLIVGFGSFLFVSGILSTSTPPNPKNADKVTEVNPKVNWDDFTPTESDSHRTANKPIAVAPVERKSGQSKPEPKQLARSKAVPKSTEDCEAELGSKAVDRQLVADCILAAMEGKPTQEKIGTRKSTQGGWGDNDVVVEPEKARLKKRAPPAVVVDREQQDRTGYIQGQPRGADGGLSTFTVDNRRGGKDAVARIYLNGEKPAVRHMYIKQGETFKAETLMPGTYVFRYRHIGSEDTYEAERKFSLTQTETEIGTRYSNVTVTLFTVKDGNMQTRKVDSSKF